MATKQEVIDAIDDKIKQNGQNAITGPILNAILKLILDATIVGPTGPMGPQGNKGDMGAPGPVGPMGPQGPQGLTGNTGPAGRDGTNGTNGTNGVDGTPGATGPQGPQGIQGLTGPQGLQGPAGPAGPIGPQGLLGPVGPSGPEGPQGPIGPQGNDGPAGPQGPIGPAGENTGVTVHEGVEPDDTDGNVGDIWINIVSTYVADLWVNEDPAGWTKVFSFGSQQPANSWVVYGTVPFGKYSNGQTVPSNTTLQAQMIEAYQNVNPPVYVAPTASEVVTAKLAGTGTVQAVTTIEVGQVLDFTIDPNFVQNDAGALVTGTSPKPLSITKSVGGGATTEIGTVDPTADNGVVTSLSALLYTSIYNYQQGAIKNNDAGVPDNRGQIAAGSKSAAITVSPRYKIFYGPFNPASALNSANIRALGIAQGNGFIWETGSGSTIPIELFTGTTYAWMVVAIRSGIGRSMSKAIDLTALSANVLPNYQAGLTTVNINDGGTGSVLYDVYVYKQAGPYTAPQHNHEITI